jgi:hypothetical protein
MSNAKLAVLYQQREDAIARLFHAWIDTRVKDADCDTYEELNKATDALTVVHAAIVTIRQTIAGADR